MKMGYDEELNISMKPTYKCTLCDFICLYKIEMKGHFDTEHEFVEDDRE